MNLEAFGLAGVPRLSYYEQQPQAFNQASRRLDVEEAILARAPSMKAFLRSDPDNHAQAAAHDELRAMLEAAVGMVVQA